ncbi:MAG TPA: hypothetical protein VFE14_13025 [Micromonosporaceae bacterium]|nr:hypothetical protein [Micromonosporaceae bacterium]
MKRLGIAVVIVLAAVAGCGSKAPTAAPPTQPATTGAPSPSSPASAAPSGAPSATPSSSLEFTVDGAGPYQLGATLAALQSAGSLQEVTPHATCPGNTSARGAGIWADIRLSFHKEGDLYLAVNRSPSIPTPSGAWLGTTLAALKTIYKGVTGQELTKGTRSAYLVTTFSGRGILFDLDPGKKVISMVAGDAGYLKASYLGGTDFC